MSLAPGTRVRITGTATPAQAVAVVLALDRAAAADDAARRPPQPPVWAMAARLEAIGGLRAASPAELRAGADVRGAAAGA